MVKNDVVRVVAASVIRDRSGRSGNVVEHVGLLAVQHGGHRKLLRCRPRNGHALSPW